MTKVRQIIAVVVVVGEVPKDAKLLSSCAVLGDNKTIVFDLALEALDGPNQVELVRQAIFRVILCFCYESYEVRREARIVLEGGDSVVRDGSLLGLIEALERQNVDLLRVNVKSRLSSVDEIKIWVVSLH